MLYEKSFGIIPLRCSNGKWELFVVQLKSGCHWGFPKGRLEQGESPKGAAMRELKEETNLKVTSLLLQDPLKEQYRCRKDNQEISKEVFYFMALVEGDAAIQKEEILDGMWVDLKEVCYKLTYPSTRSLGQEIVKILTKK